MCLCLTPLQVSQQPHVYTFRVSDSTQQTLIGCCECLGRPLGREQNQTLWSKGIGSEYAHHEERVGDFHLRVPPGEQKAREVLA